MTSMSLSFNMEFQFEQLQVMKEKLLHPNGDVYATFMAEKLKRSFGLRALPSLEESQPVITFDGDTDEDVSFTLVYYSSRETSPLNHVLKHYLGSQLMNMTNEVYTLLYDNTLNTSATGSEISEVNDMFHQDLEEAMDDLVPEIEEEQITSPVQGDSENNVYSHDVDDEAVENEDLEEDDISSLQKESLDGQPHESIPSGSLLNHTITEKQATIATMAIVKNPQIIDRPLAAPSTNCQSPMSNYSIKYCDTKKLILNKKASPTSSTVLNDFNSLPGQGLREHLLFPKISNSKIYTPKPPMLKLLRDSQAARSPAMDASPPSLMIDDTTDPEWSPSSNSKRRSIVRRTNDHLRTALTAVKSLNEGNSNINKKWVCNFKNCGKTFSVRSHLDTHKVTHTGEKRYICNICGGRFTQSSSLRNHRIAIHTKEYPHNCSICKKGFLLPSQLKKHRLGYHGSRKHLNSNSSTSSHANALAAKILASAKAATTALSTPVPTVPPVPTLWSSRDAFHSKMLSE